jgi:hypothetical protein
MKAKLKAPPRNFLIRLWDEMWFARHFMFATDAPPSVAAELIRRIGATHQVAVFLGETEDNVYRFTMTQATDVMIIARIYRDEGQTFIEGKSQFDWVFVMTMIFGYPYAMVLCVVGMLVADALGVAISNTVFWTGTLLLPLVLCFGVIFWKLRKRRNRLIAILAETVREMDLMHDQWEQHGRAVLPPRDMPEAPYNTPLEPAQRKNKSSIKPN